MRKRKPCVAKLRDEGRHAVSKIIRAVGMKIVIEDSKRCNTVAVRKSLKIDIQKRGVDRQKAFDSTLSKLQY